MCNSLIFLIYKNKKTNNFRYNNVQKYPLIQVSFYAVVTLLKNVTQIENVHIQHKIEVSSNEFLGG
jgi:hypothetical protein